MKIVFSTLLYLYSVMPESKLLLVAAAMTVLHSVSGQSSDTLFVTSARQNSVHAYELATAVQSGLFNGFQYIEPKGTNDEHPFFRTDEWQEGDVAYKGQVYKKLALLYDVTTDRLVTELFNGQPYVLIGEHLDRFTLAGRNFVKIDVSKPPGSSLGASGFYEEVYDGATQVLARHIKVREERIESATLQIYFTPKSRHYVLNNGTYTRITNKSSLLTALKEHKSELRAFIKKQKLKFSSAVLSQSLAAIASYNDTLKPAVD
jgi:hypothetical protein